MTIKLAQPTDLEKLCNFYEKVCVQQQYDEYSPKWTWEDYPSTNSLKKSLATDQVIINIQNDQVVAAGILSQGEDPAYRDVPWKHPVADQSIAVLHLFAVDRDYRGQGISQKTLHAIINQVKQNGQKVIHLDIIDPNLPAEKAYLKVGFLYNNSQQVNYSDLGPTPAKLFEFLIQ